MPSDSDAHQFDQRTPEKPAIVFHDVSKTFQIKHAHSFKQAFIGAIKRKESSSDFHAVDHVGFEVPPGQSIALMGRNGSGKSTTLKLLSGVMEPDTGWIRTRGRMAGLLEVGAGFHPDLTGRQNVYLNAAILGMSKEETDARFDDILEFSEIGEFIDTEVKRYSSGMYSRLGFSVAVHTELDTLLVDEILSVGDAQFRKKCEAKMLELQKQGKTMFIVSHNASQVKRLCQRGIVLEHGRVVFDGPIDEAVGELQRVKSDFLQTPLGDEVRVAGVIRKTYDKVPAKFGRPLGNEVEVTENGGGSYQEFEKGLIMVSRSSGQTTSLFNGPFLRVYRLSGGPAGPWGFRMGRSSGSADEGGIKEMPFQNGIAAYSDLTGVYFEQTMNR
ncbi:ATP-binding cassette domain-containing protein [Leucobacter sp. GX24907]